MTTPPLGFSTSSAIQAHNDYFNSMKSKVESSKYRILNWNQADEEERLERSVCHYTAQYVEMLFAGPHPTYKRYPRVPDATFEGTVRAFNQPDEKAQSIVEKLLNPSKISEHIAFRFHLHQGDHSFVIEKKTEKTDTYWRIYQSYACSFTLAEWLGIDPWFSDESILTEHYKKYGQGKCLTVKELNEFLKFQLSFPTMNVTVSMYNVDSHFLERLS